MDISLFWNLVFIASLSQGLFLFVILISQYFRTKYLPQLVLGVFILAFSFNLASNMVYWNHLFHRFPHFMYSAISVRFLFAPLFFFYCMLFMNSKWSHKYWLHFIPFLLVTYFYLPLLILSGPEKLAFITKTASTYVQEIPTWKIVFIKSVNWLLSLQLIIYPLVIFRIIHVYLKQKGRVIDQSKLNQLTWLRFFNSLFLLYGLMMLFYIILVNLQIGGIKKDFPISLVMCIAIYCISYVSIISPNLLNGERLLDSIKILKYSRTRLNDEYLMDTIARLERLAREEHIYVESDIKLDVISEKLDIPRHHLSQALSLQLGMSFTEYLNRYRVAHAQRMLDNFSANDSIKAIMYSSGFNNRASFNNNFKKRLGMTPSEYIKRKQVS